jgi:hypothetical protein
MTRLNTHPRYGIPGWLNHLPLEGDEGAGGGGGKSSTDTPSKDGDATKDSDKPPAQGANESEWKAWSRKWEDRAKENSKAAEKAAEENKALKDRLDKLTPLEKLAAALGADPQAGPTDVDKLTERVTDFEKRLAEEQTARFRAEVANEKKLTADQAKWLTGSTKDELAKSADELLAAFKGQQQEQAPRNGLYIPQSGTGDTTPKAGSVNAGREMYRSEREKHRPSVELQTQN